MSICPACHGEVSVTARFCPHCGVEQASPASEPRLYQEVCEIDWWRGYAASEFYARVGADGEAVARSPAFRWRRGLPDEDAEQVRNAYAELVRSLLEDGWQPDGQGPHWFSRRFFRDVDLNVATRVAAPEAWAPPAPVPEATDDEWNWNEPDYAVEPEPEPEPEPVAEAEPEPELEPAPELEAEPELLIHAVKPLPPEPLPSALSQAPRDGVVLRLASRERAVQLISVAGLACSVLVGWRVLF